MWTELDALAAEIDACSADAVAWTRPDADHVIVQPRHAAARADAPLVIAVARTDRRVATTIEGWREDFGADPDDPDDDGEQLALDLIAAVLFGRLQVRAMVRDDGRATMRSFVFTVPAGTVVHRTDRHWRWPWQRVRAQVLANAVPLPPGLSLGPGGALPWAPWAGTLAVPADEGTAQPFAIDGELDLHPIPPREVKPLVLAYIDECRERGVLQLRIVHGKGIGALRRTVHAILADHPAVASYRLGGHGEGSWGATMVTLRARERAT